MEHYFITILRGDRKENYEVSGFEVLIYMNLLLGKRISSPKLKFTQNLSIPLGICLSIVNLKHPNPNSISTETQKY